MMPVYTSYNQLLTAYGLGTDVAMKNVFKNKPGVKVQKHQNFPDAFCGSIINKNLLNESCISQGIEGEYTKMEKILLLVVKHLIEKASLSIDDSFGVIISTTKGNIDVLDKNTLFPKDKVLLSSLGNTLKKYFSLPNQPLVVSNACISGLMAIMMGKRILEQGRYKNIIIVGADVISSFVLSGFNAFKAMSNTPCKPFDINRNGINLGEVGAALLLTTDTTKLTKDSMQIKGIGSANDANHISGPSREGKGLSLSISQALKSAELTAEDVDYISAHGTATPYNDDMESKAFNNMGLSNTPVNGFKGYLGHTLGAASLVETIVGLQSIEKKLMYATLGHQDLGVAKPIHILKQNTPLKVQHFLKTSSGFGGCNAAVIFSQFVK